MGNEYTIGYASKNSILLINALGRIRELYTPFRVMVNEDLADLKKGTYVYVEEIVSTKNQKLIYIINAGAYSHSNFKIVASF